RRLAYQARCARARRVETVRHRFRSRPDTQQTRRRRVPRSTASFRSPRFFRTLGHEQMSRILPYLERSLVRAPGTCNVVVLPRLGSRQTPDSTPMHREFSYRLDKGFDSVFATSKAFGSVLARS